MTLEKKIPVEQIRPGMYIHDVNCGWMDHPFVASHFPVRDQATLTKIASLGVREVYIDVSRGADVEEAAPTAAEVRRDIASQMVSLAEEPIMIG